VATIRFHWPVQEADLTNIIEEEGTPAKVQKGRVNLTFGPHEIQTLSIVPKLR